MVVRYFPMFKKRVVFDPKHHGEKRERVVQRFEKTKIDCFNYLRMIIVYSY